MKADRLEPLKGSSPAPDSGASSPAREPTPKQVDNTDKKKEEPQKQELSEDDLKLKAFLSVSIVLCRTFCSGPSFKEFAFLK